MKTKWWNKQNEKHSGMGSHQGNVNDLWLCSISKNLATALIESFTIGLLWYLFKRQVSFGLLYAVFCQIVHKALCIFNIKNKIKNAKLWKNEHIDILNFH